MIEFTDYKTLVDTHAKNWTYDTEGERVKWTDMRVIVLNKAEPSIVSFKCNYNDADLMYLCKSRLVPNEYTSFFEELRQTKLTYM